MKKLGKLSINVDKIIKNEELVNLKGGDYGYDEACTCTCVNFITHQCDYVSSDDGDCTITCWQFYGTTSAGGVCGNHPEYCGGYH